MILPIATALTLGLLVLWWARRARSGTAWTRLGVTAGMVLVAIGTTIAGTWIWALTATDTSQLARAIAWGDSGVDDLDRFPVRTMAAADDPFVFESISAVPIAGFTFGPTSTPLPELLAANGTTAFIVVQGDQLLYEAYFNGSGHDATQTSFSVAKSFVATLIGIAIDEGSIGGLDDAVTDYVPELAERDDRFGSITLRHLITMSSGIAWKEGASPWADPANTYHGTDLRSAVIETTEIEQEPGLDFHYNDWNVILLGLVLERAAGESISSFTETRLWQPMGAEANGSWSLDSDEHRFEKMFVGVNGRAVDFAKLGWLYLQEGHNGTEHVVSSDFVAEATALDTSTDPAEQYQYLWWVVPDGSAFFANGDHGQFIYVDPTNETVIVRHGTTPGTVDWISLMGELSDWSSSLRG
jgi:CubicO group peptidase (beta-lactamase class C family)